MTKIAIAAIALSLASTSALAQTVDVGTVNWSKLPALKEREGRLNYADLATKVEGILKRGCKIPGQSARRFDITVPYAALVEPNGKVSRVVVSDMKCPELEVLVGHAAIARSDAGDFLPTGADKASWYGGAINFNLH
ncbi:hypothetical protein [Sphingomonas sp. M1-B02]|uniref:hypothetical protein n=1 Tax=Sphingomonas sp. M1-B02 TaxID=3114300 RepID=UPI00223F98D9|nr:hypothetical protein [Sphingomonas sp. S6-11]UZK64662.1 hypothetical protein OKW87_08910 [Sphingomonas sp. S6-11]